MAQLSTSDIKSSVKTNLDRMSDRSPHTEGKLTRQIEEQTAKIPSVGYLSLAVVSMLLSAGFAFTRRRETANFIGLWVPSILLLGVYNKLVKLEGSDMYSRPDRKVA
jgi:hypothetical protein